MATLKVYHTASPSNAVYKSLGTAVTLSTDIVLPPSFDLYGDALRVISDTTADNRWNYAELTGAPAAGTWYYFIDKIEYLGGAESDGNGYVLHLRIDPLMTFKTEIKREALYVARNETDYDPKIPDTALAQKSYFQKSLLEASDSIASPLTNSTVVVQTVSKGGQFIYFMDVQNYVRLCDAFWGFNWQLVFTSNPISCITRTFMLPWSVAELTSAFNALSTNTVIVANTLLTPSDFSASYLVMGAIPLSRKIAEVTTSMTRDGDTWKNKDDRYLVYEPYCGIFNMSGNEIYFDETNTSKNVTHQFFLDAVTGDLTVALLLTGYSYPIHYASGNAAIPIPFTADNTTQRYISAVTGLVSSASSGAATVLAANPATFSGAAFGLNQLGGVGGFMNVSHDTTLVSGTFGATTSWALPQRVYVWRESAVYVNENNTYWRTHGRPLYQTRTGSQLSGFTICQNVHVQPDNCSATVAAEIKRLLESGVYFDDGQ